MVFFQVSWIRRSDLKILTIGDVLYTQDQRFMPIHDEGSSVWILKLTNPKVKDSGDYECQVSYHEDTEKQLTMPFSLTVLGKVLLNYVRLRSCAYLYINLTFGFTTVCAVSISSQTIGLRPPNFLQAYLKLGAAEPRSPKKNSQKISEIIFF
jgi:hypothetical protein